MTQTGRAAESTVYGARVFPIVWRLNKVRANERVKRLNKNYNNDDNDDKRPILRNKPKYEKKHFVLFTFRALNEPPSGKNI